MTSTSALNRWTARWLTLLALLLPTGLAASAEDRSGVFVMGVDGMDPEILLRLMAEGKMPNFQALAQEGSFQSLGTSNDPRSSSGLRIETHPIPM